MATWRLLSSNGPVNLLSTRTLATMKKATSKIIYNIEKNVLPPKPKKPLNPYFQYLQSVRNKLKQEHPDMKYVELLKKVSQEWIKVDPKIKQEFQKQYSDAYTIYKQKLDDYNNSITDKQKVLIKERLMEKMSSLEKTQIRQKLTELGRPKRPITAYLIFLQSKKDSKDSKISQKEWIKNMSHEWNNMTIEDKEEYNIKAKQLLEKYNTDMKEWEKYMIQAGHSDLLEYKSKQDSSINKYEE